MEYTPKPIDTTKVELPQELVQLQELLAENAHEIWSEKRISEGWQYGPARNDDRKENPCLVPYSDLPEIEKEYDRKMVSEVLKCIVALGFKVISK